jgi:hypothetical protein
MTLILIPWFLMGACSAIFNHITRLWTVTRIQPNQKSRVMAMVFVGALVRLLVSGLSIYIALRESIFAALAVFAGLWSMRGALILINGLNIPESLQDHRTIGS